MLEQRIEKLDAHVAELTAAVERLIATLGDTNPPPAAPAKAKPAKSKKTTSAKAAPAEEPNEATPEPAARPAPTLTIEDVRRTLVDLVQRADRKAALDVLAGFDARKVGDIAPGRYSEVIAAAKAYGQKEAA